MIVYNAREFLLLEDAVRVTFCSASMKARQTRENGRDAWFSLKYQCARVKQVEGGLEKQEYFANQIKWKDNYNCLLAQHVSDH